MRRIYATLLAALAFCGAHAGGYLTNTNQSATFGRFFARQACIGIDGAYANPAGIGFMSDGWHLGLNMQSAVQTRTITGSFGNSTPLPFSLGAINGVQNPTDGTKKYDGKATAPFIPSIDVAWVKGKYSLSAHFGITGGGGKCIFDNGIGTFESQVAALPLLVNSLLPAEQVAAGMGATGYSAESYMRGRQYYWSSQVNFGLKINPKLVVSAGLRVAWASNNYYGYVRNISVNVAGQSYLASDLLTAQGMPHLAALATDKALNCDQTGFGLTPILAIDWKSGKWNLSARWEMKTRMRLKNKSGNNTSGIAEFDDGKKIPADLPPIIFGGVQYSILPTLRVALGGTYYVDRKATQYEHREELLRSDGVELLAGIEWDINDWATISGGGQYTNYGLGTDSKFITNLSFVTDSYSLGCGAKFKLSEKMALEVSYFKTFYMHYTKHMDDYNDVKSTLSGGVSQLAASGVLNEAELAAVQKIAPAIASYSTAGIDRFDRTNDVLGIALDIDF